MIKFLKYIFITVIFVISTLFVINVSTNTVSAETPTVSADSWMITDLYTGQILDSSENKLEEIAIGGLTKLFVSYIVYDEIKKENITLDQKVDISDYSVIVSHASISGYNFTDVVLYQGLDYTVGELLEIMNVYSSNSAAIALAEHISGSEFAFLSKIHSLIDDLGMSGIYNIDNVSGLDNNTLRAIIEDEDIKHDGKVFANSLNIDDFKYLSPTAYNTMNVLDVSILSYMLVNDFSEILDTTSKDHVMFYEYGGEVKRENKNFAVRENSSKYNPNATGLATGTMDILLDGQKVWKDSITLTVNESNSVNNYNFLVVSLGSSRNTSNLSRYDDANALLEYAKSNFTYKSFDESNLSHIKWELETHKAKSDIVKIKPYTPFNFYVPNDFEINNLDIEFGFSDEQKDKYYSDDGKLLASLDKGTEVGFARVKCIEESFCVNYLTEHLVEEVGTIPIVTSEDVRRHNIFKLLGYSLLDITDALFKNIDKLF